VSVLFADLVGFTTYAEGRDAEEVRETLSAYFDVARDVIERYGGTIEKFIGDAVMAVWGAPVAREDDAERAVRAALDLVGAVPTLGPTIQARAGVLTGEAAVTVGAIGEGMVAGDLVNTAARLQSVAPEGAVLVGEATQRAAASAIAFEEAGEQLLKGKSAPVPVWRALRVVAQRGGYGRSDVPEPPFVGRDDEFRLLKDAVVAVGRERRARLVSISGPGGIGKSRLAWELEKYIDGVMADIYWHRGRSPAYGEGITFWALGEMVRRRAGLAEGDDEPTTRARITATVAEYVPDADDQRWVEPALLTLLGLEPPPAGGRDMLFAAWRIFFERIAARGTTLLLFEDLQWADSGLLDFIEHLLEWSKGAPILVVTLARPELFDRRPDWGAGARHATTLALDPLSPDAMRGLLAGFVPGLPERAVATILGRADGIPLYAVETVRALVADGRLERVGDAYRPVGDLDDLAIPETLRSLIASRLDALEAVDRTLLQDASVLGQVFGLGALAAIASGRAGDLGIEDLERRLRALIRRELLEVEADPRSPERGLYRFLQSLIREVAYGMLARRDRRDRHLAAARYFEAIGEDELASILASHYLAAYQASTPGDEAEAVAAQARIALRAAAERATALGAHAQAVEFLTQALGVTTPLTDRAELLEAAARSATSAGSDEPAEAFAREAIAVYHDIGDPAAETSATALLGSALLYGGKVTEALEVLEAALASLPDSFDDAARARLLTNLSRANMRADIPLRAIELADQALPIAERLYMDELIAEAFNNKGSALSFVGRTQEAIALLEAAVAIAAAGGFTSAELRARGNLSSTSWARHPRRAVEAARETLDLARRLGNQATADWVIQIVLGATWLEAAAWDKALADADERLAAVAGAVGEAGILLAIAPIRMARGDPMDAVAERLEAIVPQISDPSFTSSHHGFRADRAFLRGRLADALQEWLAAAEFKPAEPQWLNEAMRAAVWQRDAALLSELAERHAAAPDAAAAAPAVDGLAARSGLAALEGRLDEAVVGYRRAIATYHDFGFDFFAARTVIDAVRVLGGERLGPDLVDEARGVFERVGAQPYLTWLDEALAIKQQEVSGRPVVADRRVPVTTDESRD
jgi:class 3 adenylate cyclase/predicted ATPase